MKNYTKTLEPGEIRILPRKDFGHGPQRLAELKLEETEAIEYAREKDSVVLRRTEKGGRNIQAKFLEVDREVYQLTLNYYTEKSGFPHDQGSFPLRGQEIDRLFEFLDTIRRVHLPPSGLVVEPGALDHDRFTDDKLIAAIRDKPELAAEIIETQATSRDVKAVAFRRTSLETFEKLLKDEDFFESQRSKLANKSAEQVWQNFFEANQWVFGYGLSYVFHSAIDPENLEIAVAGFSLDWKGKRPDAVMKTRGAVNGLCLVEIKVHNTPLLKTSPARPGTYAPSQQLTDAISQSQMSVVAAERILRESFTPKDPQGNPLTSSPIYNYRPRAFVVVGQLSDFETESGLNEEKYSSFEMYRRNLVSPEVITFDELYERAKYIVEHSA